MKLQRNQLMLGALGLVALFYFGDLAYRKLYEEPTKTVERLKGQYDKRLLTAKRELLKATRRVQALELLEQRSLPWNAEMARERYAAWLLEVAKTAKMTDTRVDARDPVSETKMNKATKKRYELFKRFSFTLTGRGDLNQVTEFLYEFYHSGHLQKIRSLTLNPVGQSGTVDMNVSVEALALPTTERESELADIKLNDVSRSFQLAQSDLESYKLISRRNLFGRGGARWGWKQIVLRAATVNVQGVGEAWLATGAQGDTEILPVGESLSLPAAELQLVQVDDTSAIFNVEGQHYKMIIGQSLADAKEVAAVQ